MGNNKRTEALATHVAKIRELLSAEKKEATLKKLYHRMWMSAKQMVPGQTSAEDWITEQQMNEKPTVKQYTASLKEMLSEKKKDKMGGLYIETPTACTQILCDAGASDDDKKWCVDPETFKASWDKSHDADAADSGNMEEDFYQ